MNPKSYFIAVVACVLSASAFVFMPFKVQVGGDLSYYEPSTLLIVAATALVAIVAGLRALRSPSSHRLLIAVFILPLSSLLFVAAVSFTVLQHHRFL